MRADPESDTRERNTNAAFVQTHWSVVLAARDRMSPQAREALERLCETYWYPLYAFVRRRGHAAHEAEDLTQDFFRFLLEDGVMEKARQEHGRFRTFLLTALTNFLNNEWDKRRTLKRGGGFKLVSWDEATAENWYGQEPAADDTPKGIFERAWTVALLDRVKEKLRRDYSLTSRIEVVSALEPYLTGETGPGSYANAGKQLGMSEGAVKVALHRLRRRFGELLRQEIAQTVATPGEIDEEIRYLFAAFSG